MHACIVRINCQNKCWWARRQSTVAGLQLHLCCCGTATHACVSVSSKDTGHWSQRWCSNTTLSAITWPALQRLSFFSIVICSLKLSSLQAALASLIFNHTNFQVGGKNILAEGETHRGTARPLAYQATYPWGPWRCLRTWWAWFLRVCW